MPKFCYICEMLSAWGGCKLAVVTCCRDVKQVQGTKIFQYCTCTAGRVTYNIHSSCKHMHLSFKSVCNKKKHKVVICNMSNSSQSTHPTG